jgi:hypothetical protein
MTLPGLEIQLISKCYTNSDTGDEMEYSKMVYQLFIDFKTAHDSVRSEVPCNILI